MGLQVNPVSSLNITDSSGQVDSMGAAWSEALSTPNLSGSSSSGSEAEQSTSPVSSYASEDINSNLATRLCTSPKCPIDDSHSVGLYTCDHGEARLPSKASRRLFLPSCPPPNVAEAYERCLQNDGGPKDELAVASFHKLHTEPFITDDSLQWTAPFAISPYDDDTGKRALPSNSHPFGFTNPPDRVWQALGRLKKEEASEQDKDFVESYAVDKVFTGSAVGTHIICSNKRRNIRKPGKRYMKELIAQQTRAVNEMHSLTDSAWLAEQFVKAVERTVARGAESVG